MSSPGILHVTYQPSPSTSPSHSDIRHDAENSPTDLQFPFVARDFRYQACDNKSPSLLSLYELSDINSLDSQAYADLKDSSLTDEHETRPQAQSELTTCQLFFERAREGLESTENAKFLIILRRRFKAGMEENGPAEYAKWFAEEHVELVAGIPGWRRSRAFRSVPTGSSQAVNVEFEYFTIHEYDFLEEMKATMGRTKGFKTEWKDKVDEMLKEKSVREWELCP